MNTSLKDNEDVLSTNNICVHQSPQDWRDHWVYFLLVDRFNNHKTPPSPNEFPCNKYQGGNFKGIKKQLPYLKELGVGAIWMSPILMNPQWFDDYWGGYGIQNFLRIEPRFCKNPEKALKDPSVGDKEFQDLVDEIHKHGIYVIMDIVINHVGDLFNYEGMRDSAPWNKNKEYDIYWRNELGEAQGDWKEISEINNISLEAGIYPIEFQKNKYFRRRGGENSEDITQGDFGRFKELASDCKESDAIYPVRNYIIKSYQYLIGKFDVDGFRIDTAQYVQPEFLRVFGNSIREYALSIGKKNFYTCGEIWNDDDDARIAMFVGRDTVKDGEMIGIDAAINFPLRKRLYNICKGFMPPSELAYHFDAQRKALGKIISSHGNVSSHYLNFCDNHDLNDRFHHPNYPKQTALMLTCLMTLNGIPCIYYGTEQGFSGSGDRREYSREAFWSNHEFDSQSEYYLLIKRLSEIRNENPVIKYGRQYFRECSGNGVDFGYSNFKGGIISFSRILNDKEVLIVANTSSYKAEEIYVVVDKNLNPESKTWEIIFSSISAVYTTPYPTIINNNRHSVKISLQAMEALILI